MGNSNLLTKKEFVEFLNCSETAIDRIRKKNLIAKIKIPSLGLRFRRVDAEKLEEWIQ